MLAALASSSDTMIEPEAISASDNLSATPLTERPVVSQTVAMDVRLDDDNVVGRRVKEVDVVDSVFTDKVDWGRGS